MNWEQRNAPWNIRSDGNYDQEQRIKASDYLALQLLIPSFAALLSFRYLYS